MSISRLATASVLANVITLAASPVITRLFTPAEMGLAALLFNLSAMIAVGASLKLDSALIVATDQDEPTLFKTGLVAVVSLASLAIPIALLLQHYSVLGYHELPMLLLIFLPALVAINGALALARAHLVRVDNTAAIARCVVWGASSMVLVRIASGALGIGTLGIVFSEVVGVLVSGTLLLRHLKRTLLAGGVQTGAVKAVLKKHWRFPVIELPSAWLGALAGILMLPMVIDLYGVWTGGLFGLAFNMVLLANRHVEPAVSAVFYGRAGELIRVSDRPALQSLFVATLLRLALIAALLLPLLLWIPPLIFGFVFGEQWADGGNLVALLAPFACVTLLVAPLSTVLSALHRQSLKLLHEAVLLLLVVGLYLWAIQVDMPLQQFVRYFSFAAVISYGLYLLLIAWAVFLGRIRDQAEPAVAQGSES